MAMGSVAFGTPILKTTKAYQDKSGLVVEFRFDSLVDEKTLSLEFINNTIQLNIPQAKVIPSKQNTKIPGTNIRNIYTYQASDELARSRVIYTKDIDVNSFKDRTILTANGPIVSLRISNEAVTKAVEAEAPAKPPTSLEMAEVAPIAEDKSLELLSQELGQNTKGLVSKAESELSEANISLNKDSEQATTEEAEAISAEVAATTESAATKAESEIPVMQAEGKRESSTPQTPWNRMMIGIGVSGILLLGLTLFMKKYWRQNGVPNKHTNIRILTQHHLGPKKSLAIIRVAGESMLIGITDQNINLIKPLSLLDEEIPEEIAEPFAAALTQSERNVSDRISFTAKPLLTASKEEMQPEQIEGFTMRGLKDVVSQKLKGMKEI